ncbi:NlpC/P60 family protein [Ferrimonas balearica]|uniref:NlpC/P60 family protein n=1 Tax=Ferrimonas balearica TaxID=44012 RepID=UPI001C998484|nr:NlpC/P60 family protein [Ferrimonas balearica]MBY5991855.1 C40 family peptidase [Ferrimonas balearica]
MSIRTLPLLAALLLGGCAQSPAPSETSMPQSNGTQTVQAALKQQYAAWAGVPHRWGGNSRRGVDCSGLVQLTYQSHFNRALPRTTAQQVQEGQPVARERVQAGDLVFFKTGANQRHVGMMVDSERFLHASTSKGVILSRLDNPYWSARYWQARRVL